MYNYFKDKKEQEEKLKRQRSKSPVVSERRKIKQKELVDGYNIRIRNFVYDVFYLN